MQVFVINLARCADRMARVKARLDALGVAFTRVEAVDDAQMDRAERRRHVSRIGWWACSLRPIVKGQIGCTLSHQKVYRLMRERGLDQACVLEDDVVLDDRFPDALRRLEQIVDATRPQVMLLFDHTDGRMDIPAEDRPFSVTRLSDSMFAEGYVLTRRAAENVLKANYPMRVMDDIWGRWVRQGRIELYGVRPAVCTQESQAKGESLLGVGLAKKDLSPLGRLWWTVRRVVGLALDACSGIPEFRGVCRLICDRAHPAGKECGKKAGGARRLV